MPADLNTPMLPGSPLPMGYAAARPPRTAWIYAAGVLLLTAAIGSAAIMALGHLNAITIPGCGKGSACDQAASGPFGKIPGIGWPVSFLGVAYFAALLAAWLLSPRGLPRLLQLVLRCGAVLSIFYIGVMLFNGYLCKYCLGVHAANLLLLALVELPRAERVAGPQMSRPAALPLLAFVLVFAAANAALGIGEQRTRAGFVQEQTQQFDESTAALLRKVEADRARAAQPVAPPDAPVAPPKSAGPDRAPDPPPSAAQPDSFPID